jgi:type II secretory ATPase GspE/PulE/Tfp pilus assembly ATPase PilB-like protein
MESVMREGSLGWILFSSQIITEEDIRQALAEQQTSGCRFGEALVRLGVVTQEDIDWALSHQLDIPYVRLKKDSVDPAAVALVPAAVARQFNLMPVVRAGDELSVAMADPLNRVAIAAVERASGCHVTVSVGFIREIRELQDACYGPATAATTLGFASALFPATVLEQVNADLSGATFFDYLLLFAVQNHLASLSLEPLGDAVAVTGRRAGRTRAIGTLAMTWYPEVMQRLRKLARLNGAAEAALRGEVAFRFKGRALTFQALILRGLGGDYATLRPHVATPFPASIAELGIAPEKAAPFRDLTALRQGLVLFSLADAEERCRLLDIFLDECDTAGRSVLLLGERLGHGRKRFPRIPCHDDPQLVLAALEHDPDVLVIEDATEAEVFIAASKAALRGKLVIAGLALHDLASTVGLLHAYWRKSHFLPTTLKGIVSCKGVLVLCPDCRERVTPAADELAALRLPADAACFAPRGCPACDQSGHRGRRYLLDVIPFENGLVRTFETAGESGEVLAALTQRGYRGILEEGTELLLAGEISLGEYLASILH